LKCLVDETKLISDKLLELSNTYIEGNKIILHESKIKKWNHRRNVRNQKSIINLG